MRTVQNVLKNKTLKLEISISIIALVRITLIKYTIEKVFCTKMNISNIISNVPSTFEPRWNTCLPGII